MACSLRQDKTEQTRIEIVVFDGALFLGEAGILRDRNATTNPAALEKLSQYVARAIAYPMPMTCGVRRIRGRTDPR
jgi:transcriptional regulator GlxA family with amidase domain